MSRIVKEANL